MIVKTFPRPTEVRVDYIKSKIHMLMHMYNIKKPPIDAEFIIGHYGEIIYDEDSVEGLSILNERTNKYAIFLNPKHVRGRVNWTICHELGHIVLEHFTEYDVNNLTKYEFNIIEREADIFAREILMPSEWIRKYYSEPLSVPKLGKLKRTFDVSWEALCIRMMEVFDYKKEDITELFNLWNLRNNVQYKAIDDFIDSKSDYEIQPEYVNSTSSNSTVEISLPDVDENMRYIFCPSCRNNVFSDHASHCKYCGYYLYNSCQSEYCDTKNVADSLYCEYCGTITYLGKTLVDQNIEPVISIVRKETIEFWGNIIIPVRFKD